MIKKSKLITLVAELTEMLREYGAPDESIVRILVYHGFTKEQVKEWYGIPYEQRP